ncbi:kinesin family protein [Cordyceps militaris CM01]|uniref:Kinesin-like protein n=1 Tax=Cordyceps militaris (strain CM01) TaxID=983644 RepID=G3JTE4_CORMM|nr:kinesin family protein [Cordyceps militaris CM01]EGX88291.1 kinesin family protein [Cordyceps militaris CM01]
MDAPPAPKTSQNLFEVYLRLRPPPATASTDERVLTVEPPAQSGAPPSHITLNPPSDRRRAIERFGFTQVFAETASQLDVFSSTEIVGMVEGVLAPRGGEGTDAVVATLGVTGSGKTHTILGSKTQRGLTQLAVDVVFRSIGPSMLDGAALPAVIESLQACDSSESTLISAPPYLETVFADHTQFSRANSRAATPMICRSRPPVASLPKTPSKKTLDPLYMALTATVRGKSSAQRPKLNANSIQGDFSSSIMSAAPPRRNLPPLPTTLPKQPDVSGILVPCDTAAEYVVVVSMYEVHNDRIYDLLTPATKNAATKEFRRRPLLFKSTELSPDRKVVAGLRKVVCTTAREALLVLEAGLQERRVTGTGSNSVSSRSHGFFCFEVKKRHGGRRPGPWGGSKLTVVDLAGSERAREAKTAGATLVEAGKINESLMYLGQCLQTQSELGTSTKPNVVPYRQCKLTELLFSNSFPSHTSPHMPRRNPQNGVMIVTADPTGDFNATSQILRYSALAREVTVPRIPSITATILAGGPAPMPTTRSISPVQQHPHRPFVPAGGTSAYHRNHSPVDERATMEIAALEIARLSDEIDQLRAETDAHMEARFTAEAHLLSMEDRLIDLEAAIRDECAAEYEQTLMLELARFKTSLALEQERGEEHLDRKVDLLARGLENAALVICDEGDEYNKENVLVEDLSEEVERLRRENAVLKRELAGRSPTKRKPLEERDDFSPAPPDTLPGAQGGAVSNLGRKLERMRVNPDAGARSASGASNGSPKKMRRIAKAT